MLMVKFSSLHSVHDVLSKAGDKISVLFVDRPMGSIPQIAEIVIAARDVDTGLWIRYHLIYPQSTICPVRFR